MSDTTTTVATAAANATIESTLLESSVTAQNKFRAYMEKHQEFPNKPSQFQVVAAASSPAQFDAEHGFKNAANGLKTLFNQQRAAQKELCPDGPVPTDQGILGATARLETADPASKTFNIFEPVPLLSKDSVKVADFTGALLTQSSEKMFGNTHAIAGPVYFAPKDIAAQDMQWRFVRGTSSVQWVAFMALTDVELCFFPYSSSNAAAWAEVAFKGEHCKDNVSSCFLPDQCAQIASTNKYINIPLEPGQVIVVRAGMPIALKVAEDTEADDFVVQSVYFERTKKVSSRTRGAYKKALETGWCSTSHVLLTDDYCPKMLPVAGKKDCQSKKLSFDGNNAKASLADVAWMVTEDESKVATPSKTPSETPSKKRNMEEGPKDLQNEAAPAVEEDVQKEPEAESESEAESEPQPKVNAKAEAKAKANPKGSTASAQKRQKRSASEKYDQLKERYASLTEQIDALDPRAWNPEWQKKVDEKAAEFEALDDTPKSLKLNSWRDAMNTLQSKIDGAEDVLQACDAALEDIRTTLSEVETDLLPMLNKSRHSQFEKFQSKLTDWEGRESNIVGAETAIKRTAAEMPKFLEHCRKEHRAQQEKASKKSSAVKRSRSPSKPKTAAPVDLRTLSIPTVDEDEAPEKIVTDMDDLMAIVGATKTKEHDFALLVQMVPPDAAGRADLEFLYDQYKAIAAEKRSDVKSALANEDDDPDEEIFNMSRLLAYQDALESVQCKVNGAKKTKTEKAFNTSSGSSNKSAPSRIVCEGCEERKNNFKETGFCSQCFVDYRVGDMMDQIEAREESLSHNQREKYVNSIGDALHETFARLQESRKPALVYDSWLELYQKADQMLPEYSDSFIAEDDSSSSAPPGLTKSRSKKLQPLAQMNIMGRGGTRFFDEEEEEEEFEAESSASSVESEDALKEKKGRKRSRSEQSPEASLAVDTLKAAYAIPVTSIRNELVALYNSGEYDALRARLVYLKGSLKKVFGIRVVQKDETTGIEPFEHDTCFLNQTDAIARCEQYNATGMFKAQLFNKDVEF